MTRAEFAEVYAPLAAAQRGPALNAQESRARMEAMFLVVGQSLTADEFKAAALNWMRESPFFPAPSEILRMAEIARQDGRGMPAATEASRVFDRVTASTVHELASKPAKVRFPHTCSSQCPTDCDVEFVDRVFRNCGEPCRELAHGSPYCEEQWDEGLIRQHLGSAAADAFMAAGGNSVFSNLQRMKPDNTWFVRKAFTDAYAESCRRHPEAAVPLLAIGAGADQTALPAGLAVIGGRIDSSGGPIDADDETAGWVQ